MDELCSSFAVYFWLEFIAVVEAFAECLHLIATASEGHQVARSIVFEVELESLLLYVEGYAHKFWFWVVKLVVLRKGSLCFVSLGDAAVNVPWTLEVEPGVGIAKCIVDG